jgi:chromosome segregation ATPase
MHNAHGPAQGTGLAAASQTSSYKPYPFHQHDHAHESPDYLRLKAHILMLEAELRCKQDEITALRAIHMPNSSNATPSSSTCAAAGSDKQLAEVLQQLDEANQRVALQQGTIDQMAFKLQQVTADLAAEKERGDWATAAAANTQEQLEHMQQALEASKDEVYSLQAACVQLKTQHAEAEEAAAAKIASMTEAAAQLKREKRDIERWLATAAEEADMAREAAAAAGQGEAAVLVVMATLAQQHADNKAALQQALGQQDAAMAQAADISRKLKAALSNNKKLRLKAELTEAAWGAADEVADRAQFDLESSRVQVRLLQQQLARKKSSVDTWKSSSQFWQKLYEEQKERVKMLREEKQVVARPRRCKA